MIEPKRIGRFLKIDDEGFVIPDVSLGSIGEEWKPVVDFISHALMESADVSSVYIRGSIPRSLAISGISDADFIYFSDKKQDALEKSIQASVRDQFPHVNGVELSRLDKKSFNEIFYSQTRPYFQMLLKTQALHLKGDDLVSTIPKFRPDTEMYSHLFALEEEFASLPAWLKEDREKGKEQATWKWMSKRIVRSGLEVTLPLRPSFSRDLYLCYEQFAEVFPERKNEMYRVLVNALNGIESPLLYESLVHFLIQKSHLD